MNDVCRSSDDTADRRERLRECRKNEIDLVVQFEMANRASAALAEHAECVRLIDEDGSAMLLTHRAQPWKVGDRTLHGKDAVGDDELSCVSGDACELARQLIEVVVREPVKLAHAKSSAIDE